MIQVERLLKKFDQTIAVRDVSFAAADGCITGLLGPNGAGKTTTLRMIAGLLRPDGGAVRVDGVDAVASSGEARRAIGVLPESWGLYGRLTGRENVRYFGELQGLAGRRLDAAVEDLVRLLDFGAVADRRAEGYSQGERMKVAIARALVHGPRNVVLDEPTRGLDVMSVRSFRTLLRRLRDTGKCVIFSSHVMPEISALCDRVVVIARGSVTAEGAPSDLLRATGSAELEDAFVDLVVPEEARLGA